jgi:H+-translocating NAD(P) transhydrogenase subunit alpha
MVDIILMFLVLILTFIIGYHFISKVPSLLHTPLMSMTNAISGITILAAVVVFSHEIYGTYSIMGFIAVVLATLNVVGGFTVTDRMLKMFKKNRENQTNEQRTEIGEK